MDHKELIERLRSGAVIELEQFAFGGVATLADEAADMIEAVIAERDALRQQLAEALIAAKYAEHIDATPENQRETMLYDTLMERNDLRQALAEAQARINSLEETEKQLSDNVIWQAGEIAKHLALIEASRMQEPVAGMYGGTKVSIGAPYPSDIRHGWTPLFTAPVVADDVLKDANRYRHIVESLPPGTYADCTVYDKESWDSAIDSEITGG